jgi:hypothetical protein
MSKPTKLQKEILEVIREELDFMKKCNDINSSSVYKEIDKITESMINGTMDPQLTKQQAGKLSDILYEIVTQIRDLER